MAININPYVTLDGNAEEAVKFWAEALGGKAEIMKMGDSPMPVPPEHKNRVMHATIRTDTFALMASDSMPGQPADKGSSVAISLNFTSADEQTRVWERLSKGANVTMPLGDQFFGRFGTLIDRFGIPWMLHYAAPQQQQKK